MRTTGIIVAVQTKAKIARGLSFVLTIGRTKGSVLDNFKFETFVVANSNIFEEYLRFAISNQRETKPEYRSIEEKIDFLYR